MLIWPNYVRRILYSSRAGEVSFTVYILKTADRRESFCPIGIVGIRAPPQGKKLRGVNISHKFLVKISR